MRIFISILAFYLCSAVLAQDCGNTNSESTSIDLRVEGHSMYGMPILDQGTHQYCYSYTGSMMLSAWINSQHKDLSIEDRQQFVISPAVSGVITENMALSSKCSLSHPCDVVNMTTQLGGCRAKNAFTAQDGVKMQIDGFQELNPPEFDCNPELKNKKLENFYQEISDVVYKKSINDVMKNTKDYTDKVTEYFRDRVLTSHPEISDVKAQGILKLLNAKASGDQVSGYIPIIASWAPACISFGQKSFPREDSLSFPDGTHYQGVLRFTGKNSVATRPICKKETSIASAYGTGCKYPQSNYKQKDYDKFLRDHFNRPSPQPVGISYCPEFLRVGLSTPLKKDTSSRCHIYNKDGKIIQEEGTDHKSMLIGRRLNKVTGQCEYLLRNSAGNECDQYSGKNSLGLKSIRERCKEEKEKSGYADIWVPAKIIVGQMHGVSTLE